MPEQPTIHESDGCGGDGADRIVLLGYNESGSRARTYLPRGEVAEWLKAAVC